MMSPTVWAPLAEAYWSGGASVRACKAIVLGRFAFAQLTNSWVSTGALPGWLTFDRRTSIAPNQKSLFFMAGPPKVALTSCRWDEGSVPGSKSVRPDKVLFV